MGEKSLNQNHEVQKADKAQPKVAAQVIAQHSRQENQQLGIPLEIVKTFTPRLQELVGFGTYLDLVGHIDKQSPAQALLGRDDGFVSVWDRTKPET